MKFNCDHCGKGFERTKRQIKKGTKNMFCNSECHNRFRTKKKYDELSVQIGEDLKGWLTQKYWVEEMNSNEIAKLLYGKPKNGPNVMAWMDRLGIKKRGKSEAVALQWKDNEKRKAEQTEFATTYLAAEENRDKLRRIMKTARYRMNCSIPKQGAKNPMWKDELTDEQRKRNKEKSRSIIGYKLFKYQVLERDKHTCQKCGSEEKETLVVHHIESYKNNPKARVDPNNGITLCENCHKQYHKIFGIADGNSFSNFMC